MINLSDLGKNDGGDVIDVRDLSITHICRGQTQQQN